MPKDTIERAIARGSGDQEAENLEETIYEGYGPNGVAIIVETLTDNKNRTVAEVRHAFSKYGGSLGTDGSVAYLFNKIGQIVVENSNEEKIFDVSVSNGADEVEKGDEDNFIISVEADEFHNLKNILEENEIKINQYELIMKASNSVELDDEASEKVINLLESLEDLDDVQNVHSNAEFSEGSFA
jgi:YebC/PmpR family DNA-binding regulatory protein